MEIKKIFILLLLLFSCVVPVWAQQTDEDHRREKHERIQAARIAHITSRLNLSSEQAQKFWPVYNEFSAKRDALRSQHRQVSRNSENFSNEQALNAVNAHVRIEKEEAALEEEYYTKKLLAVLEAKQVLTLMHAEHEFKKMLLERLKDKRPN